MPLCRRNTDKVLTEASKRNLHNMFIIDPPKRENSITKLTFEIRFTHNSAKEPRNNPI